MIEINQKPVTLRQKRVLYTNLLAKLLLWINENDIEVAIGQDGQKHMAGSLHFVGLANDLIFYKDGVWLQKTDQYKKAGEYWESLHPLCCWGGRFKDGNHFSLTHDGKK